jgi:hypothetical protein
MHKEIVDLSKVAIFIEVEDDDIVDSRDSHSQPLNNEELAEFDQLKTDETRAVAAANDEVEIHKERGLTLNGL